MKSKISSYAFSKIYPMYIQKVEKKGRTKGDVDTVIYWLTGYDEQGLQMQIARDVEEIADPLTEKIRWLDKLVDEVASGKAMDKILRE